MYEELIGEKEACLKDYYGKVIEAFGKENLIKLLQLMKQLDTVMTSKIEEMEVSEENDRDDGIDE